MAEFYSAAAGQSPPLPWTNLSPPIDLIAHREADDDLKLIQQKARWTIARKYVGRKIWIAFRDRGEWFLAPHDVLVGFGEAAGYTATPSWIEKGLYHMAAMTRDLRERCEKYRLPG